MIRRNILLVLTMAGALLAADPAVDSARKKIADKKYDDAIAQLEKAKPGADVNKTLADAWLGKADTIMNDNALPPRTKYPDALKAYRAVLKYDKDNKEATQSIKTIEDVYKSMGRPIPQ